MSRLRPSYKQGFARYAAESANPGLWKGLVGLWAPPLGPTGLTLFDHGSFKSNGVLQNMEASGDWVIDERGYSLLMDGGASDEYITFSNPVVTGPPYTINIWVKLTNLPSAHGNEMVAWQFRDADADSQHWNNIRADDTNDFLQFNINDGGTTVLTGTVAVTAGVWEMYTGVVKAADSREVYLNGGGKNTSTASRSPAPWTRAFAGVQQQTSRGDHLNGQIGLITLYDQGLSQAKIQQLYELELGMLELRSRTVVGVTAAPAAGNPWYQYAQETAVAG